MKWQYLGTAAAEGFPAVFCACDTCKRALKAGGKNLRLRSGLLVNDTVLIDLNPDILTFVHRHGMDLSQLTDLFITHSHSDHLDVQNLAMRNVPVFCQPTVKEPLHMYCNEAAHALVTGEIKDDENGSYTRFLDLTVIEHFHTYTAKNGLRFTWLPAEHAPWEKAGIYLIEDGEKTALYAHDTGRFPEETMAYLKTKSLDLISLDCTYGPRDMWYGHMGIPENRRIVEELRQAGALKPDAQVILHHFTHNCGMLHEELEEAVAEDGFLISYDGMIVNI